MAGGDALKKVRSGDRLRIPAKAYNRFVDAARAHRERDRDQRRDAQHSSQASGVVLVRNQSGEDRDRFDVLGLDSPIITPGDNLDHFKNRIAFNGVTPDAGQHGGAFVILLEPLKEDAIGRGCVAGVCVARVQVEDDNHRFAIIDDEDASRLKSAGVGPAEILWHESGTGEQWSVVRLGNDPLGQMVPVTVTQTGGDAGGWSSTCSFTYEVKSLGGETLLENTSPLRPRLPNTEYETPGSGSYGLAFRDTSGDWRLYDVVQERPKTKTLTVLTDYGIDTSEKEFWKKQRPIRVLEMGEESDRITVHSGTEC